MVQRIHSNTLLATNDNNVIRSLCVILDVITSHLLPQMTGYAKKN